MGKFHEKDKGKVASLHHSDDKWRKLNRSPQLEHQVANQFSFSDGYVNRGGSRHSSVFFYFCASLLMLANYIGRQKFQLWQLQERN